MTNNLRLASSKNWPTCIRRYKCALFSFGIVANDSNYWFNSVQWGSPDSVHNNHNRYLVTRHKAEMILYLPLQKLVNVLN